MTDTEAIALRADRARERHVGDGRSALDPEAVLCSTDWVPYPCETAQLAADIPELLARVRALEGVAGALYEATREARAVLPHGHDEWLAAHPGKVCPMLAVDEAIRGYLAIRGGTE